MTRTLRVTVVAMILVSVTAGCATYAASRYSISPETVSALRAYRPKTVAVGRFTAAEPGVSEITCRAVGPIKTPDGEPFEEFIRRALIAELTIAELSASSAPITLTGDLERLGFTSGVYWSDAAWDIALTVKSSNGKSLMVRERYAFSASYAGGAGCQNTAQALMPAVQNLVGKIVMHPEFRALLE
jgi:hypothetical protein